MALRSLPCHIASSYIARLTGNLTQDLSKPLKTSQKEVPQPPRMQANRIAKHSLENIEKCIGSRSMSAPQSVQEMVYKSNQLGGQGSTQHP